VKIFIKKELSRKDGFRKKTTVKSAESKKELP